MNSNSLKNLAENVGHCNDVSNNTEYGIKESKERSINNPLSSSNDNENVDTIQTTSEFDVSSYIDSCGSNCICKEVSIETPALELSSPSLSYITSCGSDCFCKESSTENGTLELKSPSFSTSSYETCHLNCSNTSTLTEPEVTKNETLLSNIIKRIEERNRQTTMPRIRTLPYFMFCLKCKEQNTNPYFQYCFQCFFVRMVKVLNKPGPKPKSIKRIQRCYFPKKL